MKKNYLKVIKLLKSYKVQSAFFVFKKDLVEIKLKDNLILTFPINENVKNKQSNVEYLLHIGD